MTEESMIDVSSKYFQTYPLDFLIAKCTISRLLDHVNMRKKYLIGYKIQT